MSDTIDDRLVATLRAAQHVVVVSGAGISAESGIATFRDAATGLWSTFNVEEFGSPDGFARQPDHLSLELSNGTAETTASLAVRDDIQKHHLLQETWAMEGIGRNRAHLSGRGSRTRALALVYPCWGSFVVGEHHQGAV